MEGATLLLFGITYVLGLILGAALGSFVNMLTYRVYRNMPLGGRSFADGTGEVLTGTDLIPVFSYILSGGRSKTSGERLPLLYPAIELAAAVIVLFVFVLFYNPAQQLFVLPLAGALVFVTGMIFFASYDYQYMSLPKKEVVIFSLLTLLIVSAEYLSGFRTASDLISSIAGSGLFALLIGLIRFIPRSGLTVRDVVLTAATAAYLGFAGMFWAVLFGSLAGSVAGIVLLIRKRDPRVQVPYATVLAAGSLLWLIAGQIVIPVIF